MIDPDNIPDVGEHMSLARWVVRRFVARNPWLEHLREDLESAAYAGMVRAAQQYDPERGSWSTLGAIAALNGVRAEVRRIGGPVRTPNGMRVPICVSMDEVKGWSRPARSGPAREFRGTQRDASANRPETLLDVLPSDGASPEQQVAASEAPGLLDGLTEREREVLMRRAADETLEAIGERFGLTRERIRQIERDAIEQVRRWLGVE